MNLVKISLIKSVNYAIACVTTLIKLLLSQSLHSFYMLDFSHCVAVSPCRTLKLLVICSDSSNWPEPRQECYHSLPSLEVQSFRLAHYEHLLRVWGKNDSSGYIKFSTYLCLWFTNNLTLYYCTAAQPWYCSLHSPTVWSRPSFTSSIIWGGVALCFVLDMALMQ